MTAFADDEKRHRETRISTWERCHRHPPKPWLRECYQRRLAEILRFLIPAEGRVLELGCGNGDLLAALKPRIGLGVDFSFAAASLAKARHPALHIVVADAHKLPFKPVSGGWDAIVLSDLLGDLWDVQAALEEAMRGAAARTRLIANFHSRVWEPVLWAAQRLGLARRRETQNWITADDMEHFLRLSGWEPLRRWAEILVPLPFCGFANRWLVKCAPFRWLALANFAVARPKPWPTPAPSLSVVIPVRNEEGNVEDIFRSLKRLRDGDEALFVEGGSRDDTFAAVSRGLSARPTFPGRLLRQSGHGKADAVRMGFAEAHGDILVILDGDLTVAAEMLPRFYDALRGGEAEFANGVRLLYPMEKEAMRPLNFLANKLFTLAFSWLLGQPVKDTLCGTKALWREDYRRIVAGREYFGDFDPFGDFDLLFGAAKLNLKIADIPVRYRSRSYGAPNISRWRDGWLLLRMVLLAARRIKFV